MGGVQRYKVGGIEKVVDMFNHFDRSKEKQILDKLDVISPPLAEIYPQASVLRLKMSLIWMTAVFSRSCARSATIP
jgi:hypothetical protein